MKIYRHKTSDAPVLSRFSYQLDFNVGGSIDIVKLRIREGSMELVEYMIQSCPIQNAFKMDSTQPWRLKNGTVLFWILTAAFGCTKNINLKVLEKQFERISILGFAFW